MISKFTHKPILLENRACNKHYSKLIARLAVFIICFSLLFKPFNQVKAQFTPVDPQTAAQLQSKLDELVTIFNLKGLSSSVIIPGIGTWNGVSGISHTGVPIDTAMVFAMGSITKTFTSTAILLLQEDGSLSISDSLHQYLPAYPNIDTNITIQQLLQHTSGIYNYFNHPNWVNAVLSNPGQAMTPQFVLNNYIGNPTFAPGTSYEYSNTNYLLLGLVIEQITGQTYASFIRQRLLDPYQLTSLYVKDHEPDMGVIAHNWTAANPSDPGVDISSIPLTAIFGTSAADGALFGNAYDLARWGQLLFTGQVLQPGSLQMMTQFIPINLGLITGYGLGLMRYSSGNTQSWGHGGNIRGFASSMAFCPADSIVVSVLSNKSSDGHLLASAMMAVARQQLLLDINPVATGKSKDILICFPNPVQDNGIVKYSLHKSQNVKITLQNNLGQIIQTLISQHQQAGEYFLTIDTKSLESGIYYCTMQTEDDQIVKRWILK